MGRQPVHQEPQREDVDAAVEGLPREQFRRERAALRVPRLRRTPTGALASEAGAAEIQQLDDVGRPIGHHAEAIGQADIAVDNALLVRRDQGQADLLGDRHHLGPVHRPVERERLLQALPLEMCHHQVRDRLAVADDVAAEVDDVDDVRVTQPRRGPRLREVTKPHRAALGLAEHPDHHASPVVQVLCLIDGVGSGLALRLQQPVPGSHHRAREIELVGRAHQAKLGTDGAVKRRMMCGQRGIYGGHDRLLRSVDGQPNAPYMGAGRGSGGSDAGRAGAAVLCLKDKVQLPFH